MPSAWIEHVKKYASENGVSYRQAMKDSKATYVSVAKPKKKYVPKPGAKPRGRPKKEREQMGMEDFDAPAPPPKPQAPKKSRKRRPKMKPYADLAGDAEAEFDENDPVNFMSVKEQRELEPIPEAPFKQPPTLVLPKPYIEKIPTPKKFLYKNPLLEREIIKSIKTTRGKQIKNRIMREVERYKFKDVLRQLEDPILEKKKQRAIELSEAYTMGQEDRLSAQEREYIREKNKPTLDLIAEKEKNRLARYKKEADKILARQVREKEIERIYASYGVKSKPKHLQGLDDILEKFKQPASRNDWWAGKP